MPLDYQIVKSLTLEALRNQARLPLHNRASQVEALVKDVFENACLKGVLDRDAINRGANWDREGFYAYVQQTLWQLLPQGVIVWGKGGRNNDQYPFFRITEYGKTVLDQEGAQPYDPDGFLKQFRDRVPNVDETVHNHFEEAVRTFNANCFRATTVLLGGAAESALLLLHEAFGKKIVEAGEQTQYELESGGARGTIYQKWDALHRRLELMTEVNPFKQHRQHVEAVRSELTMGFNLIRRTRNAAGYPKCPAPPQAEDLFMSLRFFTEYAHSVFELIEYFQGHDAQW